MISLVEGAKAALVSVVPAGRAPGRPFADALLAFDEGLRAARDAIADWRNVPDELRLRCEAGVNESLRRGERLRLEAPALDYEALVQTLAILMDPLEVFEEAERALHG